MCIRDRVVLESTTYPGTTEELIKPLLEEGSGLKCGEDFYLGFSPERVDPGNLIYKTKNTPKAVSYTHLDVYKRQGKRTKNSGNSTYPAKPRMSQYIPDGKRDRKSPRT